MKITALQLFNHTGVIFIDNQQWEMELEDPGEWNAFDKPVVKFWFDSNHHEDSAYLYQDTIIELNDEGVGIVQLHIDEYEEISEGWDTKQYTIQAYVLKPLTAVEMAKKAIGAK